MSKTETKRKYPEVIPKAAISTVINAREELRRLKGDFFKTGIAKFDEHFSPEEVVNGSVIEIMGLPSTGKSMLLYTILLSILEQTVDLKVMFINAKQGLEAVKLRNMMIARGETSERKHHEILKKIIVHSSKTPEEIIAVLKFVLDTSFRHETLKIIVIDSMTVIWYNYLGHTFLRLKLMEEIMTLIRKLSDLNITFLITNIVHHRDGAKYESHSSNGTSSSGSSSDKVPSLNVHPALGNFWAKFADFRILINFNDYPHRFESDLETIQRQLSLYSAKTLAPTIPVDIEITDAGIV